MESLGHIGYDTKKGVLYAKICHSHYEKGKDHKTYTNLGRVLDKDRGIYKNRQMGVFSYDPETGTFTSLNDSPLACSETGEKSRPEILSFGDVWFLEQFVKQDGIFETLKAVHANNFDSFLCLVYFYILNQMSLAHAQDWLESSYASQMHPEANLKSQRCSELLEQIGSEDSYRDFFKAHIKYLEKAAGNDRDILIDSTGIPNSVHFPLTAVNTHNGKVSNEIRLIYITEEKTGLPIFMRYVAGNITDVETVKTTISELDENGIKPEIVLLDAGYYSESNMHILYEAHIDFVCRMKENLKLYKELMLKHRSELSAQENMVRFNERLLYIKKQEAYLTPGHKGYAYICLDLMQRDIDQLQLFERMNKKEFDPEELHAKEQTMGTFILVSSKDLSVEDILPVYYTRQQIEQTFDIGKNYTNLEPLRIQKEETLRGHLLITFIASVIVKRVQLILKERRKKQDKLFSPIALFQNLGYQRCEVYKDKVIVQESNAKANQGYRLFNIEVPGEIKT